jgi:hypothetical protein
MSSPPAPGRRVRGKGGSASSADNGGGCRVRDLGAGGHPGGGCGPWITSARRRRGPGHTGRSAIGTALDSGPPRAEAPADRRSDRRGLLRWHTAQETRRKASRAAALFRLSLPRWRSDSALPGRRRGLRGRGAVMENARSGGPTGRSAGARRLAFCPSPKARWSPVRGAFHGDDPRCSRSLQIGRPAAPIARRGRCVEALPRTGHEIQGRS